MVSLYSTLSTIAETWCVLTDGTIVPIAMGYDVPLLNVQERRNTAPLAPPPSFPRSRAVGESCHVVVGASPSFRQGLNINLGAHGSARVLQQVRHACRSADYNRKREKS